MQSTKWVNGSDKSIEGQGHSLTLGLRSLRFQNSNLFFSETSGLFETKFHMKAHGRKEMKIYSNKFGHMTKMAAMTIYGKNPSKIFLQNHQADCLETWYVALGLGPIIICSNDDPGMTMTYFIPRSNLVT